MKYPITPEYFKSAPKEVVELYERLEAFIISDICKRFAASETATNTAIEQIRILKRYGYDMSAIERKIRQTTGMSIDEYNAMWEDAVERNEEYYGGLVTKAGLTAADVSREALKDEVEALRKQTLGEFINITQSMGFAFRNADGKVNVTPIGRVYQRILDDAEMQILSGGASYNQAMKDAVVKLADSGLQYVDYESGWHNRIDVAARRACMTGITQVSAKYSEQYMSDLDAGYVEVTAHVGARDVDGPLGWENHKKWQGRVYRLKDAPVTDEAEFKSAPEFESTTGYGDGAGLCGWNCRHSFYPFIPGISESTYTDEDLKNIDPPPFEYDGKTYTAYEATQMQRKIETAMRASKRKMTAYESAGLQDDYDAESVKYTILRQKYTSFSQTAGLTEQMERVNIAIGH